MTRDERRIAQSSGADAVSVLYSNDDIERPLRPGFIGPIVPTHVAVIATFGPMTFSYEADLPLRTDWREVAGNYLYRQHESA